MFIRRIELAGLLSFGPDTQVLELGPLNVLIGPNGSGKSNLIEVIGLLQAAPTDLTAPIREGRGIHDWIWRGEPKTSSGHIEVVLENPKGPQPLRYHLGFAEQLPVSGSGLGDLSRDRLTDYLAAIVGDRTLPTDAETWGERLCGLGLMVERADGPPVCTIAGLVLFGHAPRRFLPQSGIRWMAFEGEDKDYRALDDRLIDGAIDRSLYASCR